MMLLLFEDQQQNDHGPSAGAIKLQQDNGLFQMQQMRSLQLTHVLQQQQQLQQQFDTVCTSLFYSSIQ